jgi:hypothetical protein
MLDPGFAETVALQVDAMENSRGMSKNVFYCEDMRGLPLDLRQLSQRISDPFLSSAAQPPAMLISIAFLTGSRSLSSFSTVKFLELLRRPSPQCTLARAIQKEITLLPGPFHHSPRFSSEIDRWFFSKAWRFSQI